MRRADPYSICHLSSRRPHQREYGTSVPGHSMAVLNARGTRSIHFLGTRFWGKLERRLEETAPSAYWGPKCPIISMNLLDAEADYTPGAVVDNLKQNGSSLILKRVLQWIRLGRR